MKRTRLGVIGGMGPKATAVFYDRIIDFTEAKVDQEHVDLIILNHASLPDRTRIMLDEQQEQDFLRLLTADIRLLEQADVANIVIPCNTAHYYHTQLQAETAVNIVNMVEEAIAETHARFPARSKIGILATDGTLRSGIYAEGLRQHGFEPFIPDSRLQDRIMAVIYEQIKGTGYGDAGELEDIIREFLEIERCDGVILACTELSCIPLSAETKRRSIDALDVLVHRSITLSGGTAKPGLVGADRPAHTPLASHEGS